MKYFSLLYEGSIHSSSEEKIIPEEEFSRLISAEEILQIAKDEVERYKKEALEEAKKLKDQAEKEGFEKGLAEFNAQILNFEHQLRQIRFEMQKNILPLALSCKKDRWKRVGNTPSDHC
jgi:type III secretion protein L